MHARWLESRRTLSGRHADNQEPQDVPEIGMPDINPELQ